MPSRLLCASLVLIVLACAPALAQAGGSGGAALPGPPSIASASCEGRPGWSCPPGSRLTLAGEELEAIDVLVFAGKRGTADDRRTSRFTADAQQLVVRVPAGVAPGPLRLHSSVTGGWLRTPALALDGPVLDEIAGLQRSGSVLFAGSRRPVTFSVNGHDGVEVVNVDTGAVVRSWPAAAAASSTAGEVRWNGMVAGRPVPTGRYAFRLPSQAQGAASAEPFTVYDHLFPIRGRHDLGQSATNGFGGGRGHQGQDMFARCGTPLAAVTSGRVRVASFDGRGGNYVVIDGGDGRSYVYMHMRDTPLVRAGQRVFTGQRVGVVGETGHASGCHLHFELWSSPGWYRGGAPQDPLPLLTRWDSFD